jgi:hypothetical protein
MSPAAAGIVQTAAHVVTGTPAHLGHRLSAPSAGTARSRAAPPPGTHPTKGGSPASARPPLSLAWRPACGQSSPEGAPVSHYLANPVLHPPVRPCRGPRLADHGRAASRGNLLAAGLGDATGGHAGAEFGRQAGRRCRGCVFHPGTLGNHPWNLRPSRRQGLLHATIPT